MTEITGLTISIKGDIADITLNAVTDYDPKVHSPKAALVFYKDAHSRRLPLILADSSVQSGSETLTFRNSLLLSNIFTETDSAGALIEPLIEYGRETYVCGDTSGIRLDCRRSNTDYTVENEKGLTLQKGEHCGYSPRHLLSNFARLFRIVIFAAFIIAFLPFVLLYNLMVTFYLIPAPPGRRLDMYPSPLKRFAVNLNFIVTDFTSLDILTFILDKRRERRMKFTADFAVKAKEFASADKKTIDILYLSERRKTLSGNFEFVNNILSRDKSLVIKSLLQDTPVKVTDKAKMNEIFDLVVRSKAVVIDDYYPPLYVMPKVPHTSVIQLWHACGAFKTFGYSRIGREGAPRQDSLIHRNYDISTVSSPAAVEAYFEAFGIDRDKIKPTGVPRTDLFFDEDYKKQFRDKFYSQYPSLRDKKIILFAPTFRGNGKRTAYYPDSAFDANEFAANIPDNYAVIVKHHPFVSKKLNIESDYADRVFDMGGLEEINDLLLVTDLLITDYSSVVFEASLLNIPMIFYAYDLEEYIESRSFYPEYEYFVCGEIVRSRQELQKLINDGEFDNSAVHDFCKKYFAEADGRASERVAALIKNEVIKNS